MYKPFKAIKVTDSVYWVGAIDWGIRDFHGYLTERGSTYNAFLVMADKITLIDTVKPPFLPELLARIGSVVGSKGNRLYCLQSRGNGSLRLSGGCYRRGTAGKGVCFFHGQ